jgi:hypothetical protein
MSRVTRIYNEIYRTTAGVRKQHAIPGLATICALVNTTLFGIFIQVTHCSYVNNIRIVGMNANAAYMPGIFQPHGLPGFATINSFPNAKPAAYVTANGFFALTNIDYIIVAATHSNGANASAKETIRNILPGVTGIYCAPYTTSCATEIKQVGFAGHTGYRATAATSKRANVSPG